MEFEYLSDITGDPVYKQKVEHIRNFIVEKDRWEKLIDIILWIYENFKYVTLCYLIRPGILYPSFINPDTGIWTGFKKSLGNHCDSFYEYLLKVWKKLPSK